MDLRELINIERPTECVLSMTTACITIKQLKRIIHDSHAKLRASDRQ